MKKDLIRHASRNAPPARPFSESSWGCAPLKRGDEWRRRRTGSTGRGNHQRGAEEGGGQGGRDPGVGELIRNPLSLQTVHTGRGNRFAHTRQTHVQTDPLAFSLSHTHMNQQQNGQKGRMSNPACDPLRAQPGVTSLGVTLRLPWWLSW